ncbi:MAG: hypothetical protein J7623_17135 [Chitinophaga sp.]|uniref:hypothetical protein n=1 Tax=Chitinophaga sp. TaxID=1869181 RepID=UPI001B158086|nr:hypothetical protein [Chitinophaga sp.]MBO9730368.1 hypothetical protein [Chitinophaga sp.]
MPYLSKSLVVALIILCTSLTAFCQKKDRYSQFVYNGVHLNQLIVDRIPDYGIAGKDGCIVEEQITLELKDVDSLKIDGIVRDVKTNKPITWAAVKVIRKNNTKEMLGTDSLGRFQIIKSLPINELQIQALGYRLLKVKGSHKQLF